jgi:hypothetical protein
MEIRNQIICPTAKYGRNSLTGDLNIVENIRPILPTITPVLIVIQNGPISDRRYFCLISYHPSKNDILKYLTIAVISFIILFSEIFILYFNEICNTISLSKDNAAARRRLRRRITNTLRKPTTLPKKLAEGSALV